MVYPHDVGPFATFLGDRSRVRMDSKRFDSSYWVLNSWLSRSKQTISHRLCIACWSVGWPWIVGTDRIFCSQAPHLDGTDLAGLCSAEACMGRAAGKRVRDQDIPRSCTLPLEILDLSHSIDTSFLAFTCFYMLLPCKFSTFIGRKWVVW